MAYTVLKVPYNPNQPTNQHKAKIVWRVTLGSAEDSGEIDVQSCWAEAQPAKSWEMTWRSSTAIVRRHFSGAVARTVPGRPGDPWRHLTPLKDCSAPPALPSVVDRERFASRRQPLIARRPDRPPSRRELVACAHSRLSSEWALSMILHLRSVRRSQCAPSNQISDLSE